MKKDKRDIVRLQVTMGCKKDCEGCSKFFDCTSPLKQDIYNNPIHNRIKKKLSSIRYKMAVMSGKGGVGKSTTLVNIVGSFRLMGAKIGALDSDFYEPTLPTFFGVKEEEFKAEDREIVPIPSKHGVKVTSVAFTLGDLGYVTWATEQLRWAL